MSVEDLREALGPDALLGQTTDFPQCQSRVVRVFISSSPSDMTCERNALWEKAYPTLQTFCQSLGLVFEVVDLWWGVRETVDFDHMIVELSLREIESCQHVSMGPLFTALIGNRYGRCLIPRVIPQDEYESLLRKASNDQDGLDLLNKWFRKDTNSVPPIFVLQPITTHYSHYNEEGPEREHMCEKNIISWQCAEAHLSQLLCSAASKAAEGGNISEEQREKYFRSGIAWEIEQAVLGDQKHADSALLFVRELPRLKKRDAQKKLAHFLDMTADGVLDSSAQELLLCLKQRLYGVCSSSLNLHCVEVSKGTIDPVNKEHRDYLGSLCEQFVSQTKSKILSRRSESPPLGPSLWDCLREELSHHARLEARSCKAFSGRQGILSKLSLTLWEATNRSHTPLVVHGPVASGKTALLCRLAQDLRGLLGPRTAVVLRLLGTSQYSCDIVRLLWGVCLQICCAFGLPLPSTMTANTHAELVKFFHTTLWEVSSQGDTLVLILDSLHRLSPAKGAHMLTWLPREVPPNVHLVVSTQDAGFSLLENLQGMLEDSGSFFEVELLTYDEGREIKDAYLKAAQRNLTQEQSEAILASFQKSGNPLHLKLMLDRAKHWPSYTAMSDIRLGKSAQEVISLFLDWLERNHGERLVGHALSCIVSTRYGLSEAELLDVLSLDDDVLSDIFRYRLPSSHTFIRFPHMLWTRLKRDLEDHMIESRTNGIDVLGFFHRQFSEMIRERYLRGELQSQVHALLSEYFLGQWSEGRPKSILLPSLNTPLTADRKVRPQPLWLADGVANLRKLHELPYQLVKAGKREELRQTVLGNVEWLSCKTTSCGMDSVIEDLSLCAELMDCPETRLVRDTFLLLKPTLDLADEQMDSSLLCTELLARLHCFSSQYPSLIGLLCCQCQDWLAACTAPVLVPKCSFLAAPGGPLKHRLPLSCEGVTAMALVPGKDMLLVGSQDGVVTTWNLQYLQVIYRLTGHTDAVLSLSLLLGGAHCVSSGRDGAVRRWNLRSGRELYCIAEAVSPIPPHTPHTPHTHLHEDRALLITSLHGKVKAWHLDTAKPLFEVSDPGLSSILGVLEDTVVVLTTEGQLSFYDSASGSRKSQSALPTSGQTLSVTCTLTLSNHTKLLLGSTLSSLYLVSNTNTPAVSELPCPASFLRVSEDEKMLLAGCGPTLVVFHVRPNSVQRSMQFQHEVNVLVAAVVGHDSKVITGAEDNIIRVWSLSTGNLLDSFHGMRSPITSLVVHQRTIITASTGSRDLHLWSLDYDPHYHASKTPIPAFCPQVALSKDGDTVYFVKPGEGKEVLTWSCSKGLSEDSMHTSAEVCCMELAQFKQLLFCGLTTGTILIYPLAVAPETLCLPPPESMPAVRSIAVSLREDFVAVAYDDSVCLFEITARDSFPCVEGPVERFSLSLLQSPVSAMALLADCRLLYGTAGGDVVLYDLKSASTSQLGRLGTKVACITASNWGSHALIGSQECVQQLWSLTPLLLDHTMEYKGFCFEGVLCATFSVNDKHVFTGSMDRTIKVWDVYSGNLLCVQFVYAPVIRMMAYKDGFVAVSQNGTFIREGFRCPDKLNGDHDPLQMFRARYTVKSRPRSLDPPHTVLNDGEYNPAGFNFMGMLKTKQSNTCVLF